MQICPFGASYLTDFIVFFIYWESKSSASCLVSLLWIRSDELNVVNLTMFVLKPLKSLLPCYLNFMDNWESVQPIIAPVWFAVVWAYIKIYTWFPFDFFKASATKEGLLIV